MIATCNVALLANIFVKPYKCSVMNRVVIFSLICQILVCSLNMSFAVLNSLEVTVYISQESLYKIEWLYQTEAVLAIWFPLVIAIYTDLAQIKKARLLKEIYSNRIIP